MSNYDQNIGKTYGFPFRRFFLRYMVIICSITFLLFSFSGCETDSRRSTPAWSVLLNGAQEEHDELRQLLITLEEQDDNPEGKFVVIQQIIKTMTAAGRLEDLNYFLTTTVETGIEDPFNAYYLLITAQNYQRLGAHSFGAHYFERILNNHQDLLIQEQSIHYICLTNLIRMEQNPEIRIDYQRDQISRFNDVIAKGPAYYQLAKTYEELGEWEQAIQAYRSFLQFPEQRIPGYPNAHEKVRELVDFYQYRNKNWIMEDLDDLVARIKQAIRTRNATLLNRYRAKVNFFAVSWEEERTEADHDFLAGLGLFLNPRVGYDRNVDRAANNREAYLRTQGWEHRISIWYLYFRRVYFPADPEIHGQWEWAGIYLGEKPFAGARASF